MLYLNYKTQVILSFFVLSPVYNTTIAKDKDSATPIVAETIVDVVNIDASKKLQNSLEVENALNRSILEKQLTSLTAEIEQLRVEKERRRLRKEVEEEVMREEHDKTMHLLNMEREKLIVEMELTQAKFAKQMEESNIQIAQLDKKAQLERVHTQLIQETKNRLKAEIDSFQMQKQRDKHIQKTPIYLKEPLRKQDNILVLSDRVIELNGEILPWTANRIVDQIQYFNNKDSSNPIFIVIGISPGGSSTGGFSILQAMNGSKAPVYVVVKEFAASMAAVITTLADKSYAYPNAEIIYHQPRLGRGLNGDNLRKIKESYGVIQKLWDRLGGAVAKKMGISLKEFDRKLYEQSMDGDWSAYGDEAQKLKWVDFVISGIEDSAISTLPDIADYTLENFMQSFLGLKVENNAAQSPTEVKNYYALAPNDFNYSYRSFQDKKVEIVNK